MKLEEYEFGFADAIKEYTRVPKIFKNGFYDTRNFVDKLLNSYEFLLVGRKGVGKSAFSARIQWMSQNINELYTFSMNFNDFEFTTFAKTGVDEEIKGTQRYKTSWDFLLLISIYKILYNKMEMIEIDDVSNIIFLLDELGFNLSDDGYKKDVTRLSKIKLGSSIAKFDVEFEKVFNTKPQSYLERISLITERMINVLNSLYLNDRKIVVIIDGLDDVLRYKGNRLEIIASLIRSADYINDKTSEKGIKILLLIREDLLSMLNDPDLNKIVQDGALYLNWSDRVDELRKIVDLRFGVIGLSEIEYSRCWDNIFPPKIRNKNSWEYVLNYTLYKPRDILQFLKYCQREYPEKEKLTLAETLSVLKIYSNKYFIEEMKNELSGFISEDIISLIPSVFRKLGGRGFTVQEINTYSNESSIGKEISIEETKIMLMYLFEAGYIGQLLDSGRGAKRSVIFKYRNPTVRIDYTQKFITHQGLHSGLGVRI